ncbi:MAG: class I SAM-dependent methyltransferase [Bryobacteraceae bacterium]
MEPSELEVIYNQRFNDHICYRKRVWNVVVSSWLARYIEPQADVLDLGCGYGEFINNVVCRKKYAIDLNVRARDFLDQGVIFFEQDCSAAWPLGDESLDVVFTSNFFEHLPSKEALTNTLEQAKRCLRPKGRIIAMGPNIRFVGGAYWDFWDHHLPLTDHSLAEAMRVRGFQIERVIDRFLPYTMVNTRPAPPLLVYLYLKTPLAWRVFGKQFLIIARKP